MLASLDPLGSEPDEWPLSDAWLLVLEDRPDDCSDDAKLGDDPESDCDDGPLLPADGLFDEACDDLLSDANDCPELGALDLLSEEIADDRESNEPLRDDTDDWPDDLLADDLLDWLLDDALGRLSDDPEDLLPDERDESEVMLSLPDDRLGREDDVLLPDSSLDDGLLLLDQGLSLE